MIVLTAIFADVLAPYDPLAAQPEIRLAAPSRAHPFGTDDIGRDVLSRVIYGSRISLWVGLLAVGIGTVAGMIIGLALRLLRGAHSISCSSGSWTRIQAIPGLMLALAIVSVLTPNTTNAMLAIAMVIIPGNSRIVRGAVLSAKQNRYVEAAQAIGCRHPRIILTHILPNVTAPILIIASIWLGNAILIEATLSLPRRGHPAADAVVGADAEQHRPRVHGAGAVARASSPASRSAWPCSASISSATRCATPGIRSFGEARPMRALVSVILVVVLLLGAGLAPARRPGQAGRRDALGALRDARAGLVRSGRGGRACSRRSGCSTPCTTRS